MTDKGNGRRGNPLGDRDGGRAQKGTTRQQIAHSTVFTQDSRGYQSTNRNVAGIIDQDLANELAQFDRNQDLNRANMTTQKAADNVAY